MDMNIDEMEAGRELDALVAEKAMNFKMIAWERSVYGTIQGMDIYRGDLYWVDIEGNGYIKAPPFSTDIAAAWLVVESPIWPPDWGIERIDAVVPTFEIWDMAGWEREDGLIAQGPAPLAICRAALKAVAARNQGR